MKKSINDYTIQDWYENCKRADKMSEPKADTWCSKKCPFTELCKALDVSDNIMPFEFDTLECWKTSKKRKHRVNKSVQKAKGNNNVQIQVGTVYFGEDNER